MADETPAQAPLLTDRGHPVGNSPDVFGRRAVHVKVANKPDEAIPVYMAEPGAAVAPFFAEGSLPITPGSPQTVVTFVVPAGIERLMSRVVIACRVEGEFEIMAGATKIGSGRTGAAAPQVTFAWNPSRPVAAGVQIDVNFTARPGGPAGSTVEAYVQASDITL